jgi:hypothetical protein
VVVGRQEVELEPGQFIFGRKVAAEATGLSEQEVRTALDSLRKQQNLTIKTTNKFSIVSITNWETYQHGEEQINQQINQPLTNKQPTTNQQLTTNNKDNKETIKQRKNKTLVATDTGLRLSTYLFSFIKDRNNGHKPPDLNKWGVDMDKMIRIDARDPTDIEKVICWCQQDDFWKNNILSPDKLRKQFDQLKLKMNPRNDKVERVAEWLLK